MNQRRINQVGKFAKELAKESTDNMELQLVVMSIVFKAVEWADSHPAWVSVEEMLPEKDGKYLFYDEVLGHEVSIYYDGVTLVPSVTHWMQLPAAPVTHWMEIQPPRKEE